MRTVRSASFVVVGNRYEQACDRCKATFSVEDVARITSALVAAVALCCAAAFVVAHPPGSAVGAENQNRWFGIALAVFGGLAWLRLPLMIRRRFVHREM